MNTIQCADLKELHAQLRANVAITPANMYGVIGKVAIEGRWQSRDRTASVEYMVSQDKPYWLFVD